MDFWDYDFWLKALFMAFVTGCAIGFGNPWLLGLFILIPLVET